VEERAGEGELEVVGEATWTVLPDMVDLALGVQVGGASAAQALRENAARAVRVAQALAGLGIGQDDVQTSGVSILPRVGPPGHPGSGRAPGPPVAGYLVSTTLTVSLRDLGRVGEVIDAAARAGGNLRGMVMRSSDEAAERRAVLALALEDARARAEALAAAAGRELGGVLGLAEEFAGRRARAEAAGGGGAPMAQAEALTFSARVRVRYELRWRSRGGRVAEAAPE
jgi:uncharacterized protein